MEEWLATNRARWDERVPLHVGSSFYDIEGFKSGRPQLLPFEVDELGPLDGLRALHLQCHIGLDTLDLARLHPTVTVTGLDFSAPAIDAANALAAEVRLSDRSRFVLGEVYRAPEALGGERFDLVYSGKGALVWLPDLARWAEVVHDLLAPGGVLYLSEFHPVAAVLSDADDRPTPACDYFDPEPIWLDEPGSYVDPSAPTNDNMSVLWQHPLGRVVSAVLAAGFQLELLHEWPGSIYRQFPWLVPASDGTWRWPGPGTLPLMYSLKAVRPRR